MRFSYSSSMCVRARCKYCKNEPKYFFYKAINGVVFKFEPEQNKDQNIISNFYLYSTPKHFTKNSHFSTFIQAHYKTSPRYFQYHKEKYEGKRMPVIIALTCTCGRSVWHTPNEKKRNKADRYFDFNIKYLL